MAQPWLDVTTLAPTLGRTGTEDWSDTLQLAINLVLTEGVLPRPSPLPPLPIPRLFATLYLPPGIYRITRPLIIARPSDVSGRFEPCSIHIVGEASGQDAAIHASCICTDYHERIVDPVTNEVTIVRKAFWPVLIIQSALSVRLTRLVIRGDNSWVFGERGLGVRFDAFDEQVHLLPELRGENPYLLDGVRDHPASPHAGICIDPFHPGVHPGDPKRNIEGDRYPPLSGLAPGASNVVNVAGYKLGAATLEDLYELSGPQSYDVTLDDCHILDCAVGLCVAPSGLPLADPSPEQISVTVRSTHITRHSSVVSVSGNRKIMMHNVGVGVCQYVFNCVDYDGGRGRTGSCPSVFGGNVGGTKYIFKTGNSGGHASINGLYTESTLSLGQLGVPALLAMPDRYTFNGCAFSFITPQVRTEEGTGAPLPLPAMNAHLLNFAHTTFNGCNLIPNRGPAEPPPAPLHLVQGGLGSLSLVGCNLGGAPARPDLDLGPSFWVSGDKSRVSYTNCFHHDVRLNAEGQRFPASDVPFSDIRSVATFHNTLADPYLGTQTVPGNLYFNHTLAPSSDLAGDGPGLRWVSGPYPLIPVKSPLLTDFYPAGLFKLKRRDIKDKDGKVIDSVPDGTATLDVEPGILQVGDLVTARQDVPLDVLLHGTAGLGGPLLLGRVVKMEVVKDMMGNVEKEVATLSFVPVALRNGLPDGLSLILAYFPRIHPPTTGSWEIGTEIKAVRTLPRGPMDAEHVPLKISWGIGQRIFGEKFTPGTYIKAVDYIVNELEISKNTLADATNEEINDASMHNIEIE